MTEDITFWRECIWWPNGQTARVHAGQTGHEREIVVNIEGYDQNNYIPDEVSEQLAAQLPESWKIENRSTRIELHPSGRFFGGFDELDVQAVRRALHEIGLEV